MSEQTRGNSEPNFDHEKIDGDAVLSGVPEQPGDPVEPIADAPAPAETATQVPSADVAMDVPATIEPAAAPIVSAPAAEPALSEPVVAEPAAAPVFVVEPVAEPVRHDHATAVLAEPAVHTPADLTDDAIGAPVAEPVATDADRAAAAAAVAAMNDDDDTPWYDRADVAAATSVLPEEVRAHAAPAADLAAEPDPATIAVAEVPAAQTSLIAPPAVETPTVVAPVAPVAPSASNVFPADNGQPIFVQAPEPPRKRGNRGFSGVVALIATVIFAAAYLAATLFVGDNGIFTDVTKLGTESLAQLASFGFWAPVAAFFLGFWLLGAFINTAKWAYWVIFGLFVGLIALAGHAGGQILDADIRTITMAEALEIGRASIFTLPALVALVLGRELPVWFGGWIARRGRAVVAANAEAQAEYQETLEAGPQLAQQ